MKKFLVIWLSSLFLFGCSKTIHSEENEPVQLTRATVTSIEDGMITFQVLDPFEDFKQKPQSEEKEPVSLTLSIDENTLFLQDGKIIEQSNVTSGIDVIFSSEDNVLTVLEIVSEK